MTDIHHGVLGLVERLVVEYAGRRPALEVIQVVHRIWREYPEVPLADLERRARLIFDSGGSDPGEAGSQQPGGSGDEPTG